MNPKRQFKMKIKFHFNEHGKDRRNWFMFGNDLERRVPVKMEGVEGLNTVGMYIEKEAVFHKGDECIVECIVIAPELFKNIIHPGSKGALWDGGFFADTKVLEVYSNNWPKNL